MSPTPIHHPAGGAWACPRCNSELYRMLFRSSDRLYRTTARRFNVVECRQCSLIRLFPTPAPNELAEFYPRNYWWEADSSASGRLAEMYRQSVLRDHVRFVARAMDGSKRLLDIGCGGGSFLRAISRPEVSVIGADNSREAARIAWSRYGLPSVCGMLPWLPFAPGSFDVVTMFHVLEHVPGPLACLAAVRDLLRPGGKLIVQVPNAASWQFLLLGDHWSGLDVPRHLTNFRARDLEEFLQASGLQVRRRKFFSLRDNPAGLVTSLCPQLEPVARRVRGLRESSTQRLLKDLLYLGLVTVAAPLALLEAAAQAGSTVMVEAVREGGA